MGSIPNAVYYCCVSKGGRILYAHSGGDHEIENLAALCLEKVPPYHKWYFQRMDKKIFGFLIEDRYVYFAIVNEGLGNSGILRFLEHVRDEFRKLAKMSSSRSISSLSSICIQEQLLPVIHRLINSLDHVSQAGKEWPSEASSSHLFASPTNDANVQIEVTASTKAPLLGRSFKQQEKKKMKDHVIAMRDIELEEHQKSMDKGLTVNSGTPDFNSQNGVVPRTPSRKNLGLMRTSSGTQNIRKKWCRQVRIVLAIDAAVCLVLLVIWLIVCDGIACIH